MGSGVGLVKSRCVLLRRAGGMLGDVGRRTWSHPPGWFEPNAVKAIYAEGIGSPARPDAAARMAEAHSKWGRKHYSDVEGLDGIVAVTEEMVDGLEGSAIPLFVGWWNAARGRFGAGRAAQLMQILRNGVADSTSSPPPPSVSRPLEAILTNEGRARPSSSDGPSRSQTSPPSRRGTTKRRRWPMALRVGAGRGPRRASTPPSRPGSGPARRRAVDPVGSRRRRTGTGYSEGLLNGRHAPTEEPTAIDATDLWCSSECTPPCQGGGRGFKSRQVRHQVRIALRAAEPGHPVG